MHYSKSLLRVLRFFPMIIVMGSIFILSHQPGNNLPQFFWPHVDKILHLCVYFVLAATVIFGIGKTYKKTKGVMVVVWALSISCVYALSDEYHQSFIPGRFVSGWDLVMDFLGALLCCVVWIGYCRKNKV